MSVAVAIDATLQSAGVDNTQNELIVDGTLTLTGTYGGASTHGDTMNLGQFDIIKSQQLPIKVEIYERPTAGQAPTGYTFLYARGTTQANGLLQVLQAGAVISLPMAEITQGATYPAALTNTDVPPNIRFRAWFQSLV